MFGFEILKIVIILVCLTGASVLFYFLEKRNPDNARTVKRKIEIGLVFGIISMMGTEFGATVDDFTLNIRDAAPLTAGLIFSGTSGIIAGFTGGIWRWLAAGRGAGMYTRTACTIATIMAGFIAAVIRKYMFDNKKPTLPYSIGITGAVEVIHMLMVFLTNMDDVEKAFSVVRKATFPMVIANIIAVGLVTITISILGKDWSRKRQKKKKIEQSFARWLLVTVIFAFLGSNLLTFFLENDLSKDNAKTTMDIAIKDVQVDVQSVSDKNILSIAYNVKKEVDDLIADGEISDSQLVKLASKYEITEINYVDKNGIIINTNHKEYLGYDMSSGEQSAAFMELLRGKSEVVQNFQPNTYNSTYMKYAGVKLFHDGFVQIGYGAEKFKSDLNQTILDITGERHVGKEGYIILGDENWQSVSTTHEENGRSLEELGVEQEKLKNGDQILKGEILGEPAYYCHKYAEGYHIIAVMPVSEVEMSRNLNVYISNFIEILIFSMLFVLIYLLIKKLIVDNINKINQKLGMITEGNLDVVVDVEENAEFASLSNDINSTVDTLKHYIDEAAARIDKELEFARQIQASMLPANFEAFCENRPFRLFATMTPAKEVGGDFYDFFMVDEDHLALVMADVSGKGIPAALFMVRAMTNLRNVAQMGKEPQEILAYVNNQLCQNNEAQMFVTVWL
ncbi:MAG: LytS/YhcK type 5TM receptor domain-containing protein, partial [Lachnospiraceae bacterium]